MTANAPSGMLDRTFVSEQQWSSGLDFNLAAAYSLQYGPLTALSTMTFYIVSVVKKLSLYSACSTGLGGK